MNLYTYFTNSHKELYEKYFLESFNKYLLSDFNLITTHTAQKTENGDFTDPEFGACTDDKLIILKQALKDNEGKWFIYADCDIQFFDNIKKDIEGYLSDDIDMVCQEDTNTICTGFLIIKSSQRMRDFIDLVANNRYKHHDDQMTMNYFSNQIRFKFLDRDKYYTIGNYNGGRVWNGEDFNTHSGILMHHANFTIGVKSKINLLEKVRENIGYNNI